jgi:hypothetical protein
LGCTENNKDVYIQGETLEYLTDLIFLDLCQKQKTYCEFAANKIPQNMPNLKFLNIINLISKHFDLNHTNFAENN